MWVLTQDAISEDVNATVTSLHIQFVVFSGGYKLVFFRFKITVFDCSNTGNIKQDRSLRPTFTELFE